MNRALILAAGCARRLHPLTLQCPKCLLPMGQKPMLGRAIDNCLEAGLTRIAVVTGFCQEMIKSYLGSNYPGVKIEYFHNPVYDTTNNIYSLYLARDFYRSSGVMLMDSDIVFDPQILVTLLNARETCLAVNTHALGQEEIKVITNSEDQVIEISKTCDITRAMGESVGLEYMLPDYAKALAAELEWMVEKEGMDNVFYERAFERLIPSGHLFKAIDTTRFFSMEVDTSQDLEEARTLVDHLNNSN